MAERSPIIECEDVPLDEARCLGRGPRKDPELYRALKEKIAPLDHTATRLTIPEDTTPTTMKYRILRVAAELGTRVTVHRVPGGPFCWCATDEDLQHAHKGDTRLQAAQRKGHSRPGRRRNARTRVESPS